MHIAKVNIMPMLKHCLVLYDNQKDKISCIIVRCPRGSVVSHKSPSKTSNKTLNLSSVWQVAYERI